MIENCLSFSINKSEKDYRNILSLIFEIAYNHKAFQPEKNYFTYIKGIILDLR